jgi:phosphatidylglycerol---prolipoprotein diacylglyceryl transferase
MSQRVAFEILGYPVFWYGIILTAGMVAATWIAARELRRRNQDGSLAWDGMFWVIGLGIVGARLYHVFSTPGDGGFGRSYYFENPLQILAIRSGGLGIYGGLIGGILGLIIFTRRNKLNFFQLADCVVPGVALGQAIGRWGNFVNQELYGGPTGSRTWGVLIDQAFRIKTRAFDFTDLEKYPLDTRFHPTFLYESLWNLAGCLLLLLASRRLKQHLRRGDIAGLFFIWYGVGRAWIELLFRPDAWTLAGGLPTAVLVSGFSLALGVLVIVAGRYFKRPPMASEFDAASSVPSELEPLAPAASA